MLYYHMDLGLTDQDAVLRAEWLEAVVAISQLLLGRALAMPGLVHAIALHHPRGRWVAWVGDLALACGSWLVTASK